MQFPSILPGNMNSTGSLDHSKVDTGQDKPHSLPNGSGGGLIEFGGRPGTDLAALFSNNNKTGESNAGANKGGLTGIASQLSDSTALIPGLSNMLKGVGNSDGSVGGILKGVVGGAVETAKNSAEGIAQGVMNGEVSMPMMAKNAVAKNYENNEQTPAFAKALASSV